MPKRIKRRGKPSAISKLSTVELQRELARRQSVLGKLQTRRATLATELAALETEIGRLGGSLNGRARRGRKGRIQPPAASNGRRRRGRHGNRQSLQALLHSLLQNKTMSVMELADAAKKAGHKSKSKNFRTIVSLALLNRKLFKRVGRGQYTAA